MITSSGNQAESWLRSLGSVRSSASVTSVVIETIRIPLLKLSRLRAMAGSRNAWLGRLLQPFDGVGHLVGGVLRGALRVHVRGDHFHDGPAVFLQDRHVVRH